MSYFIGIQDGSNVIFEEYADYTEAYEDYMQRYSLYPDGHMWMTEKIPGRVRR